MLARRTQDLSGIAGSDQIAVIHDAILPEKHNKHKRWRNAGRQVGGRVELQAPPVGQDRKWIDDRGECHNQAQDEQLGVCWPDWRARIRTFNPRPGREERSSK